MSDSESSCDFLNLHVVGAPAASSDGDIPATTPAITPAPAISLLIGSLPNEGHY